MILRALAILVGLALLGVAAHATIMAADGYGTPHSLITLGVAAGVGIGALAIGVAWAEGRRTLAACILLALVAGEAFGLLMTGERLIMAREKVQAVVREQAQARAKAEHRVAEAETALATFSRPSPRLAAALATKAQADETTLRKASEPGCASNCRQLLQAQVDAAAAEIAAARRESAKRRAGADAELRAARLALAALPTVASANPLADRLALPAWALDLTVAGLGSLAVNFLGACLLAFGAHRPHRHAPPVIDGVARVVTIRHRDAVQEADWFARTTFRPASGAHVALVDLRQAYRDWCAARGVDPLPDPEIGTALANLFQEAGLHREGSGAGAVIVGIDWAQRRFPLASHA